MDGKWYHIYIYSIHASYVNLGVFLKIRISAPSIYDAIYGHVSENMMAKYGKASGLGVFYWGTLCSKKSYNVGPPSDVCWFINPINYIYKYRKP